MIILLFIEDMEGHGEGTEGGAEGIEGIGGHRASG